MTDPTSRPVPPSPPPERTPPAGPAALPAPTRHPLAPLLLAVIALATVPALLLALSRVDFENREKTVALVMDYPALSAQAKETGQTPAQLLAHYRSLGVNGVALYEDVVGSAVQRGEAYFLSGAELIARSPGVSGLDAEKSYLKSIRPGTVERLAKRYTFAPLIRRLEIAGQTWYEWPVDPRFLPAGPNAALVQDFRAQGLVLVYRPYADQRVLNEGADWPDVPFVAFTGSEVIGARSPEKLAQIKERMGSRIPALIENTPQKGVATLIEGGRAARMFSLSPSWQNALRPEEVASKYALAARERTQRLLYLRPFPTVGETDTMLTLLRGQFARSGIQVAPPDIQNYAPSPALRWLSLIGPLAALILLGLSYPLPRLGLLVAGLAGLAALGLNGAQPFPGGALIAAITFPALGTVMRRARLTDWFGTTALSLLGVLFVSALGTDKDSMLGLDPFKGVGLTLLVPPVLVALSFLPRQDIRKTAHDLYTRPFSTGDLIIIGLSTVAFAVAFLRRGNTSSVGVSDAEAKIRQDLQDAVIRPRFKEVLGHPLLLLGLSGVLPGYLSALSMLGGVLGQASILNTFSHFHTPLLISSARALIGLAAGLVLGLISVAVVRWALKLWNSYGGGWKARLSPPAGPA